MPKVYVENEEITLRLNDAMQPGGEGTVYLDPSDDEYVIKLMHKLPDEAWCKKLDIMFDNPLNVPDVAWPIDLVYATDRTTVIGYRMPYASKKQPMCSLYTSDPASRSCGVDYERRVEVAIHMLTAIERVHQHGCIVGDLAPRNILVGKNTCVCLIDVDSFQILRHGRIYRCKVGSMDYTPASFMDWTWPPSTEPCVTTRLVFPSSSSSSSSAIIRFRRGIRARGTPLSTTELIRNGIWPYAKAGHPDYRPRTAAPFDLVYPLLQPLMRRCFQEGHRNPTARPLPAEWLIALNSVRQDHDFLRFTAPRIEAEALAAYSKAVAARTGKQRPPAPTRLQSLQAQSAIGDFPRGESAFPSRRWSSFSWPAPAFMPLHPGTPESSLRRSG